MYFILGVNSKIQTFTGANGTVYSLGNCGKYSSMRIIGSDHIDNRGVIDVTIYGNNGNPITARGSVGGIQCYKDSNNNVYIKFPSGISVNFIVIGGLPVSSTLPSDASQLSVTSYEN